MRTWDGSIEASLDRMFTYCFGIIAMITRERPPPGLRVGPRLRMHTVIDSVVDEYSVRLVHDSGRRRLLESPWCRRRGLRIRACGPASVSRVHSTKEVTAQGGDARSRLCVGCH